MNSNNNKVPSSNQKTKASVGAGVLTASVLAYCGYRLVKNQLKHIKYESNPYKDVQ